MKEKYLNASFLLAGAACLAMVVNHLGYAFADGFLISALPGWRFLTSLSAPLLAGWVGLLLRYRYPNPRKRGYAVITVGILALFCLCLHFLRVGSLRATSPCILLAMTGLGYLIPPAWLEEAGKRKGAEYIVLLPLAVFCYTASSVVSERIGVGALPPEFHEMEWLMTGLMHLVEPFLLLIVFYFSVMFSFSAYGLHLGETNWLRGLAIGAAAYTFLQSLANLRWGFFTHWTFLLLLIQPVTVWLVILLRRVIRRRN